jgi:hypothetical protein
MFSLDNCKLILAITVISTILFIYIFSQDVKSYRNILSFGKELKGSKQSIRNSNYVFNKLKGYIDSNTKKLKIYVPNFKHYLNDEVMNDSKYILNNGHGPLISYQNDTSIANFLTNQFSYDILFYNRLKIDKSVVTDNLKDANVVYIPFLIGTVCTSYRNRLNNTKRHPVYLDYMHNMTLWLNENENNFKDKALLLPFSRVFGNGFGYDFHFYLLFLH